MSSARFFLHISPRIIILPTYFFKNLSMTSPEISLRFIQIQPIFHGVFIERNSLWFVQNYFRIIAEFLQRFLKVSLKYAFLFMYVFVCHYGSSSDSFRNSIFNFLKLLHGFFRKLLQKVKDCYRHLSMYSFFSNISFRCSSRVFFRNSENVSLFFQKLLLKFPLRFQQHILLHLVRNSLRHSYKNDINKF